MTKRILFRCDGGNNIGLGHITRCISLAHILKDIFKPIFYINSQEEKINNLVKDPGFELVNISNEEEFIGKIASDEIVVLDVYNFNAELQEAIKYRKAFLICIDDLHQEHFLADIIINHTPGINPSDYSAEPYTKFLLGPEYALLRPVFLDIAGYNINGENDLNTVFICFGGADPHNYTVKAIKSIISITSIAQIDVVLGASYNKHSEVYELKASADHLIIHESLNDLEMAGVMRKSSIGIMPSSGILFEAIACGLIPVIASTVDNQKLFYKCLLNDYKITGIGSNENIDFSYLYRLMKTPQVLMNSNVEQLRKSIAKARENYLKLFNNL